MFLGAPRGVKFGKPPTRTRGGVGNGGQCRSYFLGAMLPPRTALWLVSVGGVPASARGWALVDPHVSEYTQVPQVLDMRFGDVDALGVIP